MADDLALGTALLQPICTAFANNLGEALQVNDILPIKEASVEVNLITSLLNQGQRFLKQTTVQPGQTLICELHRTAVNGQSHANYYPTDSPEVADFIAYKNKYKGAYPDIAGHIYTEGTKKLLILELKTCDNFGLSAFANEKKNWQSDYQKAAEQQVSASLMLVGTAPYQGSRISPYQRLRKDLPALPENVGDPGDQVTVFQGPDDSKWPQGDATVTLIVYYLPSQYAFICALV